MTDHHAVIPTQSIRTADLSALPVGERAILELVTLRLLCAVAQPYEYAETTVSLECAGHPFTAKGRAVLNPGWKELDGRYRDTLKNKPEADQDSEAKALPLVSEGQSFEVMVPGIKEGKTSPPRHFTEDTLLSAMETAGAKDMPDDAERKGLGTPATRAGILEKLVSAGFVERKGKSLIPTKAGINLVTVLPDTLTSPMLTAEWEHKLKQVERGELDADVFLGGITAMLTELTRSYRVVPGAEVLFPSGRPVVGKCPRCGAEVTESKNGYFCERRSCKFGLWRDNRFLAAKKISLTKKMASSLLTQGRAYASGIYSEKTGKTYDAFIVLEDDGARSSYKLDFTK